MPLGTPEKVADVPVKPALSLHHEAGLMQQPTRQLTAESREL